MFVQGGAVKRYLRSKIIDSAWFGISEASRFKMQGLFLLKMLQSSLVSPPLPA